MVDIYAGHFYRQNKSLVTINAVYDLKSKELSLLRSRLDYLEYIIFLINLNEIMHYHIGMYAGSRGSRPHFCQQITISGYFRAFFLAKSCTRSFLYILQFTKQVVPPSFQLVSTYLNVFWSLFIQSTATVFLLRVLKNRLTSLSRLVLGAKQPVVNHISSQPFSSDTLHLHHKISIII